MTTFKKIKELCEQNKQTHVLKYYNELPKEEQEQLLNDLSQIDFSILGELYSASQTITKRQLHLGDIEPLGDVKNCHELKEQEHEELWEAGLQLVKEKKVGIITLAGGQGSRLGFSHPKGMYNIGLPSGKNLFQIHADNILKLEQLSGSNEKEKGLIVWYVMTSESTDSETQQYFKENNYLGLRPDQVIFFQQSKLPSLTFDGKLILETKSTISFSPNGNGGIYPALKDCQVLEHMQKSGIEYVHVVGIDNLLCKLADPIFIAYCARSNTQGGAKVVEKSYPDERVGIFCNCKGKVEVVEYSEIDQEISNLKDEMENLVFKHSNIVNHFYTFQYLSDICENWFDEMKYHIAKKQIKCINVDGESAFPDQPNGFKFEKFIFDAFKFASSFSFLQVERNSDFAPIKNKEGSLNDSPNTARDMLSKLHVGYLKSAGAKAIVGDGICEISSLISYSGEGLTEIAKGNEFKLPIYID
ncbi:hypothetical protein M0812_19880 [Anaeramoeba flamelloides]|uniref:UDP-N-acetylglucosamine diphosphorylase n=1 Tax=Anaeramoeba flamelloides TaxID=1746091 RepID=A0AAV7Z2P2_9EUKA|nr:hypothetical protein M0812_19880 [Anaeramoeba flamelloides]